MNDNLFLINNDEGTLHPKRAGGAATGPGGSVGGDRGPGVGDVNHHTLNPK